jgi:hypothetical protein
MTSPTQEEIPDAAGRTPGSRLLKWTLIATIVLYVGLFAFSCVPFVGWQVFIFAFFAFYLWVYVGVFTSAIVFTAAFLASRKVFHKRRHRLQLAIQLSAIVFAVAGIVVMAMVPLSSGQSVQMAGYSVHTRLWLDADKVRAWANSLGPSEDPAAAPGRWPLSLMIMSVPAGRIDVDEAGNVTIYRGSALSGHHGVYITARGKNWAGERWADNSKYDRIKKIDDGVWIWSSMN